MDCFELILVVVAAHTCDRGVFVAYSSSVEPFLCHTAVPCRLLRPLATLSSCVVIQVQCDTGSRKTLFCVHRRGRRVNTWECGVCACLQRREALREARRPVRLRRQCRDGNFPFRQLRRLDFRRLTQLSLIAVGLPAQIRAAATLPRVKGIWSIVVKAAPWL